MTTAIPDPPTTPPANDTPVDVLVKTAVDLKFPAPVDARTRAVMAPAVVAAAAALPADHPEVVALRAVMRACRVEVGPWARTVEEERAKRQRAEAEAKDKKRRASLDPRGQQARIEQVRGMLRVNLKTGKPIGNQDNIAAILANDPRWEGVLAYHAMRETVWTLRPPPWDSNVTPAGGAKPGEWTAADTTRLTGWLAKEWDLDVKDGMIDAQVNVQALRNVLDPVRDYFESLPPWDEVPRLDTFIARHLGAPDTTYVRAVTARWMISIVARTYEPGAKVDCMPVFIGKQGRGKSTLLRRLCADEDWYADLDIEGNKDDAQNLRGKLIVELGEMSGMSRAEVTKLKRFVSLKIDTYRPSYERRARDFKRRCVFGGSSNEETPLRDTTGDRRYWPIDVSPNINPADVDRGITAERDQLFAEALHRYRKGETWWVDSTELEEMTRVEQEAHRKTHPWEEKVGPFLAAKLLETCNGTSKCTCAKHGVMPGEALAAIGIDTAAQDATKADIMRGILRVFGWRCTRDTPQRRGHAPWSPTGRDRPFFPPEARDGAPEPPKGPALPPTTDNPKADHQAATAHAAAMEAAFERGEATQEVVDAARMHAGEMHKRWVAELANCG